MSNEKNFNFFKRMKPANLKDIVTFIPKKILNNDVQTIGLKKLFKVCRLIKIQDHTPDTVISRFTSSEYLSGWITSCCYHPSGDYLAFGDYNNFSKIYYCNPIYKSTFGKELLSFKDHEFCTNAVTFSHNLFGSCSTDGSVIIYNFNTSNKESFGKKLLELKEEDEVPIMSLSFSPDENYITFANTENSVFIYCINERQVEEYGKKVFTIKGESGNVEYPKICYSICGSFLFKAENQKFITFDLNSRMDEKHFENLTLVEEDKILTISVNPNNDFVATGNLNGNIAIYSFYPQGSIKDKNLVEINRVIKDRNGNKNNVNFVLFSQTGKYLASAGSDGFINLYDVDYQNIETSFGNKTHTIEASYTLQFGLSFGKMDEYLACCGWDCQVKIIS